MKNFLIVLLLAYLPSVVAQTTFEYDVVLTPVTVSGLPGLHSYAFGQHNGKWLIIGGRKDGIHARQPFNAFPGENFGTLRAGIFKDSPVRGFTPSRALR